jgi:hypothetical protein
MEISLRALTGLAKQEGHCGCAADTYIHTYFDARQKSNFSKNVSGPGTNRTTLGRSVTIPLRSTHIKLSYRQKKKVPMGSARFPLVRLCSARFGYVRVSSAGQRIGKHVA